jgi:hypothetical protein
MSEQFKIKWFDRGRDSVCPPNPNYPNGIDVEEHGSEAGCKAELPYPAKRCGLYIVRCTLCGCVTVITTAGRPDDPRSVKLGCKARAST